MFVLKKASLLVTCAVGIAIGGCGSPAVKLDTPAPVEQRAPVASSTTDASSAQGKSVGSGSQGSQSLASQNTADIGKLGRTVYFDFDSSVVKDEYRPVIEAQAKLLTADRKKRELIEGHTDERGGREYNLALGQKRAEAVLKVLTLLGVDDARLEAVSYGKERPVTEGHDEAAWTKNRRAELKDR